MFITLIIFSKKQVKPQVNNIVLAFLIIKPVIKEEPIIEKDGILVFTGKLKEDSDKLLDTDRKLRLNKFIHMPY